MSRLISLGYLKEQKLLHERGDYGIHGDRWAPSVLFLYQSLGATSILDYGCGTGSLAKALSSYYIVTDEYDPAIPEKAQLPQSADLVICTDVLEHIEPTKLDNVLEHMNFLTHIALFVAVSLRPAGKKLSDGRNAHLIVENEEWWRLAVDWRFSVKKVWAGHGDEWVALLRPRKMR